MKSLLISEKTLKTYTLINDNVDGAYILPAIRMVQDIDLSTVIGPVLLKKLENMVSDDSILDSKNKNYKDLLDEYITPYMCWQVMCAIQINVNYKLTNSGVIQNNDTNKNTMDYQNNKNLQAQYEKYSNSYAMKLKNYLCHNGNLFPEYHKCEYGEHEEDPQLCSIYLGDYRKTNYIGK